jgi:hypothetical protein
MTERRGLGDGTEELREAVAPSVGFADTGSSPGQAHMRRIGEESRLQNLRLVARVRGGGVE